MFGFLFNKKSEKYDIKYDLVVNYILYLNNEDNFFYKKIYLNNLKLQKILYFLDSFYICRYNKSLLECSFEAWRYGPCIPSIYYRFNSYGQTEIPKNECSETLIDLLTDEEKYFIKEIWDCLKYSNTFDLVSISQLEGGPWAKVYKESECNLILNEDIISYFGF